MSKMDILLEKRVIRRTIREFLAHGYTLGVNDGEETTVENSADAKAIFAAMRTTDEDMLLVYADGNSAHTMPTWTCNVVSVAEPAGDIQLPGGQINNPSTHCHVRPVVSTVSAPVWNCAMGVNCPAAFVGVPTR